MQRYTFFIYVATNKHRKKNCTFAKFKKKYIFWKLQKEYKKNKEK